MKPAHPNDPGISKAALIVLSLIGFSSVEAVTTLCYIAVKTTDPKDIKEVAVFCLGALSGVLAKTGYDAVRNAIGPVGGDVNLGDDKKPPEPPPAPPDGPDTVPPPVEGEEKNP